MSQSPPEPAALDVAAIVQALNRHGVDYVVIGGVAAGAWALAYGVEMQPTTDIDITPDASSANLGRLSACLKELQARIRSPEHPEGIPFDHNGASLAAVRVWNLTCSAGPFDRTVEPSGTGGYPDLASRARLVVVDGVETPLADLADVIRSKRAANRPKDRAALPMLEEALRRRGARA
jgi:hypothetical protein